ncbi:MAG: PCC domain-containing protein [Dysosmobacter welbionis]
MPQIRRHLHRPHGPRREILAQLKIFAEKEQVKLASVTALGAVKDFTIGVFDTSAKAYHSNRFQGVYEIVSWWAPSTPRTGTFTATSTCAPVTRRARLRRASERGPHQRHLRAGGHLPARRDGPGIQRRGGTESDLLLKSAERG